MKNYLFVISSLSLLVACGEPKRSYSISTEAQPLEKSTILFSKGDSSYLYDLQITDSYIAVLDDKSDTVMQAYTLIDFKPTDMFCLRNGEKNKLTAPQFTRSDYRSNNMNNQISIVDNDLYLKQITLTAEGISMRSQLLDKGLLVSKDYNLISDEIYAVPIHGYQKYSYFFYNVDSNYYWVNPSPAIAKILPRIPLALSNNLCVNEPDKSVVSAFRFTNYISFHDLQGNIQSSCHFGKEQTITPLYSGDKLDVTNSTKCFTSIYCTSKYVYCLYDGTADFSASSKIVVFNWNGKHIKTWQTDRNLRCITVDKDNKTLYGISSNPKEGQDVVRYLLK